MQCISGLKASYERILMNFFGETRRASRTNQLYFGSDQISIWIEFLDLDQQIQEFLMDFFDKNLGGVGHSPGNDQLDFSGNPGHNVDPGIFKAFFIYYCNCYRQP